MTNYEKWFGTPEDAADSIESFMTNDVFHIGAWMSYCMRDCVILQNAT
jgi:hypothetical protein